MSHWSVRPGLNTSAEAAELTNLFNLATTPAGSFIVKNSDGTFSNVVATGTGTVTSVSVVTANGISGSVATATTTPAITLTLGAITPNSVAATGSVAAATTMTVGAAAGTTGAIAFKGTTSGTVTLSVVDAAGTWTMKLPTTAGSNTNVLTTDGSGNLSWAAAGTGTVTAVSIATANGFSGSSSGGTTPALTIVAGAIVPNTVVASDTTTPHMDTTAGSTNTGYFLVNGKTSGSLKITAADATAQAITLTVAAQTVGAATLTIPNMGNVNKTVAWLESPSFTTPTLGVATATTINKVTITQPASSAVLTITDGKTAAFSNTMTFAAGADSQTWTFPSTSDTVDVLGTAQTFTAVKTFSPAARSSGVASYFVINVPADTAQTAATESIGFKTVTATRTWATTGTVALQRENYFAGITYASASASQTFTDVTTMYIDKPIVGSNAVFTRAHSLAIVDSTSAASSITGGFVIATTLGTTATSVGIGGGNINAGGTLTVGGHVTVESVTSTGATGTGKFVFDGSPTLVTPNIGQATATNVIYTNNAVTASGNAATVPVTSRLTTVTNNSAATLTITITTASATDGQLVMVRVLDFSAVAQTITWVNTEDSTVTAPTTSNGSTTLFLTVGFIYNGGTSKWRCIAKA